MVITDDSPAQVPAQDVGKKYITLILFAQFGAYLALVPPIGISLAIKVRSIVPDNDSLLGIVLGVGTFAAVIVGPLFGMLSDRTRSRFGRRRPWIIGTSLVGLIGLAIIAIAPTIPLVMLGWIVTQVGLNSTIVALTNSLADRLPEHQRGKVAGLGGVVQMVAPVVGVGIGGALATMPLALFLVPGAIGVALVMAFAVFVPEPDSRALPANAPLTLRLIASKYVFNPRLFKDFSFNWLGKFLMMFGVTLSTAYTAYFFASILDRPVTEIGGLVTGAGLVGVLATALGAGVSGGLSDRFQRRKIFVLGGGVIFATGALIMAFAPSIVLLLGGVFLLNLGLGVFAAVDQAILLDVLPERETDAGRYNAIFQFATTVPQAVAPLAAAGVLVIVGSWYPALYLIAALSGVAAGIVVLRGIRGVR